MELRELTVFVAVAEELHFGRAADRLLLSTASVSAIVRALERDIGAELLARTSRSVRLTAAGAVFLDHARDVLHAAEQARRCVQPRLRIATGEIHPWPSLICAAISQLPPAWQARATAAALPWAGHRAALENGDIDAGIAYFLTGQDPPSWLDGVRLGVPGEAGALVSADHPLAGREKADIDELAGQPMGFLPREANPEFFDAMMATLAEHGFRPALRHLPREEAAHILQSNCIRMQLDRGWTLAADFLTRNPPTGSVGLPVRGIAGVSAQLWVVWRRTIDREAAYQLRRAFATVVPRFDLDR